nr:hypothetical protein CFP56_20427 [Quercus suber]
MRSKLAGIVCITSCVGCTSPRFSSAFFKSDLLGGSRGLRVAVAARYGSKLHADPYSKRRHSFSPSAARLLAALPHRGEQTFQVPSRSGTSRASRSGRIRRPVITYHNSEQGVALEPGIAQHLHGEIHDVRWLAGLADGGVQLDVVGRVIRFRGTHGMTTRWLIASATRGARYSGWCSSMYCSATQVLVDSLTVMSPLTADR